MVQFKKCNINATNIPRYIKMSSPHLNNLIIIGCMLTYTSVIFLGLDSSLSSIGMYSDTHRALYCQTYRSVINICVFSSTISDTR